MNRIRYIAIHMFHSDKTKEAFHDFNNSDDWSSKTDKEKLEAWIVADLDWYGLLKENHFGKMCIQFHLVFVNHRTKTLF